MERDNLTVHFCGLTGCEPGEHFGPGMRPHYLLHLVLEESCRRGRRSITLSRGIFF